MTTQSILPLCLALTSSFFALGCLATEGDDATESVESAQQAAITANAITANAITANAITANAITANAITANAITANAITANAITANALKDPDARLLFKYIVSCALPATSEIDLTIDNVDYKFPGELGLTPKWGLPGGSCNQTCQGWVSACVMARVDYLGQKVNISLRGANAAMATTAAERAAYTVREGSYYGNIFAAPADQIRYACVAPGRKGLPRVCGPTLDNCFLEATGWCNDVCDLTLKDGSFFGCRDSLNVNSNYPVGSKYFPTSLTVFLTP